MMTKIFNFKFLIFNFRTKQTGFTLIELLASIIVLVAVGVVISGIISSTLRGANKTNTIENIRQNGNSVLNQMSKDIAYALPFDRKNTGLSTNGTTYATSCPFSSNPTPTPVITQYSYISVESTSNIVTQYNCSGLTLKKKVGAAVLTELIDSQSFSLTECKIQCIQSKSTDTPIIKISFKIGAPTQNKLPENSISTPILFETSIVMKNYGK